MENDPNDYGGFGKGVQPALSGPQRSRVKSIFRIVVLFLLAVLAPFAITGWGDIYAGHLERDPPIVEIKRPPVGLGLAVVPVEISVRDDNAGIDEVTVRIEQAGKPREVLRKKYPTRVRSDDFTLELNGKDLGLREGEAQLNVVAFDRSFWNNGARTALQLRVDYTKPEVTAYPDQRNAVQGGSEMVFYRLKETVDTFSGITVGDDLLPGFPAKGFDRAFDNFRDVYCAFFPIPRNVDLGANGMKLFARDAVGNVSNAAVNYHVQNVSVRQSVVPVTSEFLSGKVDALYEEFVIQKAKLNGEEPMRVLPSASDEERIERFRAVNEKYRDLIDRALKPLFAKPKSERYWRGPFARYQGKEERSFGERMQFQFNGKGIGEYSERGVHIASAIDTPVRASNNGLVIFADRLGVYGMTLILDHGFGLTTMYTHLSAVGRVEGDRVERGDVIGKVGETGLAFSPGLGFEVRLHSTPVRPIEWWDPGWQKDHIDLKVQNTKNLLGIRTPVTLE